MGYHWVISYVDVKASDSHEDAFFSPAGMSPVEDKCLAGWEPWAITLLPVKSSKREGMISVHYIESQMQRFWFKKRVN